MAAARHGVPYAHREGALVVLVLAGVGSNATGEMHADYVTWMCSSAGQARIVERTAITCLRQFPEHNPLEVSALYAEAAWRHACRRARRAA
jgi:hypothetical protein